MSDEKPEGAVAGATFEVIVSGNFSVADVRTVIREKTGLEAYLNFCLGPMRIVPNEQGGDKIICPITAIDDPFLGDCGERPIPAEGFTLYVGYLKAIAPVPSAA